MYKRPNFDNMSAQEIQCAIDELDTVKRELNEYVSEVVRRNIPGLDLAEFSDYVSNVICDVIDPCKFLAETAAETAEPYTGPEAYDVRRYDAVTRSA